MNSVVTHQIPASYRDSFDRRTLSRGKSYADEGRIKHFQVMFHHRDPTILYIIAKVKGSGGFVYDLEIEVSGDEIDGTCSCPVTYNCKHVAAAVVHYRRNGTRLPTWIEPKKIDLNDQLDYEQLQWVQSLVNKKQAEPKSGIIRYVLDTSSLVPWRKECLQVTTYLSQHLKRGGYGKLKRYSGGKTKLSKQDCSVVGLLRFLSSSNYSRSEYSIPARSDATFMKQMLATGHCYWEDPTGKPLQLSAQIKSAEFSWKMHRDGVQELVCIDESGQVLNEIIVLNPVFSIDLTTGLVHELKLNISDTLIENLLARPIVAPNQARHFAKKLKEIPGEIGVPIPSVFTSVEQRKLKPKFTFHVQKSDEQTSSMLTHMDLSYGNQMIPEEEIESPTFTCVEGDKLVQIVRDAKSEEELFGQLAERAQQKGIDLSALIEQENLLGVNQFVNTSDMVRLGEVIVPQLQELGLAVNFDKSEFYDLLELDEWYTDLDAESEYDWFGLDMGVQVNGEKVSLLPHLLEVIGHLEKKNTDEYYYIKLEKGQILPLPIERLRKMVGVLTQFIDPNRLGESDNGLKISRYKASLLAEIEKAFAQTQMRWFGGGKLRELGQRLSKFRRIKKATPPKKWLQAQLRSYQQVGVNWLQFLREYQLGGILADDMGLGKTIQALSHILIEKHQKRLDKPCLIIAPTSVIYNWQQEAGRFTPSLKVMLLRGANRHEQFSLIPQSDIVLTTYPLVVRDKNELLKHDYHLLVLDEAQMIKNSQAKMTQVIQQLKAKHRLCLTGTPLENHLGELWSLFHFLMPGLLGTRSAFKREFQTPIEKNKDKKKLARLIAATKPFMLRRGKAEVVKDLPEKTEMIKKITLEQQQADLYESIRLAMHKKVRQVIDEKGIERSHIVVLDALLKLRQVCCDPQLVKLEAAKKVEQSAKLEYLLSMLNELIPEGRRILLFSQFTSMLSLIEKELDQAGIAYVKLTGNTVDRQKPIQQFQDGHVPLFLISLKSGGTGINLTAADTVIHYDPWWNPAVEAQATDRSHRIGQKNPVFVYKLIVENTVEEKIIAMQNNKQALLDALMSGQGAGSKLCKTDLEFLLG